MRSLVRPIVRCADISAQTTTEIRFIDGGVNFERVICPICSAELDMRSARQWIVLPDRLLVIDRIKTIGGSDQIVADRPLKAEDRRVIENAIVKLPATVRGQAFDGGAVDGIGLRVSFSPDGAPNQSTDVVLENAWCGELGELVEVISTAAGKDPAIPFRTAIERIAEVDGPPPTSNMSLQEYERRRWPSRLPWWCWWPRLSILSHAG